MAVVVDCSIALKWLFGDEATPATTALLRSLESQIIVVPSVWTYEVANSLLVAERRGHIKPADSTKFIELLRCLTIEIDYAGFDRGTRVVSALGRETRLTAYDAAYLELAHRMDLPLATLDGALSRAAHDVGVSLLPV